MSFNLNTLISQTEEEKKKRRYILFLSGPQGQVSNDGSLLKQKIPSVLNYSVILLAHNIREIQRCIEEKNIFTVIVDHTFQRTDDERVRIAAEIKKFKACPIFFITHNEQELITAYRKYMFAFQEADDYFLCPIDLHEASAILKQAFESENRTARRFSMNANVQLVSLSEQENAVAGVLEDMSMVGFKVRLKPDHGLLLNHQIFIHVPLRPHGVFHPQFGDFLKLSARVRRISIDGQLLGCSLEHMNHLQQECVMKILEDVRIKRLTSAPPVKV